MCMCFCPFAFNFKEDIQLWFPQLLIYHWTRTKIPCLHLPFFVEEKDLTKRDKVHFPIQNPPASYRKQEGRTVTRESDV